MDITTSDATLSLCHVLDACALIAFLRREPGATAVDLLLTKADCQCYVHAVNLCEVYYDILCHDGPLLAQRAIERLMVVGVQLREDLDRDFWQQAGMLKVNPGKLSLADSFALTLTLRLNGTLVTSDHLEFDKIATAGLCPVLFIR